MSVYDVATCVPGGIFVSDDELQDGKDGFFVLMDLAYILDNKQSNYQAFAGMISNALPSRIQREWAREWVEERRDSYQATKLLPPSPTTC